MKRTFLLLFLVAFLGSCRKDFANLQVSKLEDFRTEKAVKVNENLVLIPVNLQKQADIPSNEVLALTASATLSDEFVPLEESISTAQTMELTIATVPVSKIIKADAKPAKIRLQDVIKKVRKEVKKNSSTKPVRGGSVLSILSLVFGVIGVMTLFVEGLLGIGIILGIVGMICGIVALATNSKGRAMSIIGLILGGGLTLLTLLFIIAFSGSSI